MPVVITNVKVLHCVVSSPAGRIELPAAGGCLSKHRAGGIPVSAVLLLVNCSAFFAFLWRFGRAETVMAGLSATVGHNSTCLKSIGSSRTGSNPVHRVMHVSSFYPCDQTGHLLGGDGRVVKAID
jgi:hypothetical protein